MKKFLSLITTMVMMLCMFASTPCLLADADATDVKITAEIHAMPVDEEGLGYNYDVTKDITNEDGFYRIYVPGPASGIRELKFYLSGTNQEYPDISAVVDSIYIDGEQISFDSDKVAYGDFEGNGCYCVDVSDAIKELNLSIETSLLVRFTVDGIDDTQENITKTSEATSQQTEAATTSNDSDDSMPMYVIVLILILIIVILAMLIAIVILALRGKNKNTMPVVKNDSDNDNNINNEDSGDNNPPNVEK